MSTHNICLCGEIRKILCGYPLLSVAMNIAFLQKYEAADQPAHFSHTICLLFFLL